MVFCSDSSFVAFEDLKEGRGVWVMDVCPTLRFTDAWDIIIVENKALLASYKRIVALMAPMKILDAIGNGAGRKLPLNPDWKVQKTMTQEEQITECERRLMDAMTTSDIKTLDELLHDHLIFNIPTGMTITKEVDIENYRSGVMKVFEMRTTDQVIKPIGDISTVAVTVHLKAKYADQMIDGKFRYLRVWKLFGNTWKVMAGSGFQI